MGNIINNAKDKLNVITQQAAGLFNTDILSGVKEYGMEKLTESWQQIESSSELFQKTGYSITAIDLKLALPPTLILSFDQIENISDEAEAALLEEHKDKTLIYSILVALFKANAIQRSINSVQYKFAGLNIELGISPSIDMKFTKVDPVSKT
ncbi:MAG TPA: hypothetical protein PLP34_03580 [Chitinophagaceae bacterium]|nr:hypothetical protein [Chitinophagaceae bacterium]HNF71468.1 hypothetical protein [Chitinophagaceae bacterium]